MGSYRCAFIQRTIMTQPTMCFSVDTVKLSKYQNNFLKSSEGIDAIQAGELSGEERLFMALLDSNLLNSNIMPAQKKSSTRANSLTKPSSSPVAKCYCLPAKKAFGLGPAR